MLTARWPLVAVVLICHLPNLMAQRSEPAAPLTLSRLGLMYVGGREIPMQGAGRFGGGTQIVDQAPVHYLIPPEQIRSGKDPVIMVPGMGLTSFLYLGTPDGREGWATIFARQGYPVYVFDEPGNAVSGFDVSQFNAANAESPGRFMLWSNEVVWRRWGLGSDVNVPFDDTKYPVAHLDQLLASMTAVSGSGGRGGSRGGRRGGPGRGAGPGRGGGPASGPPETDANGSTDTERELRPLPDDGIDRPDAADTPPSGRRGRQGRGGPGVGRAGVGRAGVGRGLGGQGGGGAAAGGANAKAQALIKLLEKTGPATLIVHSMAGTTGFEATRLRPDLVKAIVAVEVVGSPTDAEDIRKHFADKTFIGVYGDHFEVRAMAGRHQASETTARLIEQSGGRGEMIWLPEMGIHGNTHLLMQDTNNDQIAEMIMQRLENK